MAHAIIQRALNRRQEDGDGQSVFASKFNTRTILARHSLSQGLKRAIGRLEAGGSHREAVLSLQNDPPTPHTFRATVATGLARLGISGEDCRAVLAHPTGDTHSKHYDKYQRQREKRIALEAWERHVADVISGGAGEASIIPFYRKAQQ
jgi:integrase